MILRVVLLFLAVLAFGCDKKIENGSTVRLTPERACKHMFEALESGVASTLKKNRDRGSEDLVINIVTTQCQEYTLFADVRMVDVTNGKRGGDIFVYKLDILPDGKMSVEIVGIKKLEE